MVIARLFILHLPPVAITMVNVTSDNTDFVVGGDITFTCTIVVDSAVDTDVMVAAVWSGPDGALTGSNTTDPDSDGTYESTLTLTSLETINSGGYTCTAMASSDDTFVKASDHVLSDRLIISFGEECFTKFLSPARPHSSMGVTRGLDY